MNPTDPASGPHPGPEVPARLARLEAAATANAVALRELVQALRGAMENQRVMAANQARMIEALGRLADRLDGARREPGRSDRAGGR